MPLLGIKTNTQCVHAGTDVSRQDGDLGNRECTGGGSLLRAPAQILQAWGVAGFYYHLGANIQPGVLGARGRVAMTEMKRKPGPGNPQEHRENREAAVGEREKGSERLERPKQQREKEDKSSAGVNRKRSTVLHCDFDFGAYNIIVPNS